MKLIYNFLEASLGKMGSILLCVYSIFLPSLQIGNTSLRTVGYYLNVTFVYPRKARIPYNNCKIEISYCILKHNGLNFAVIFAESKWAMDYCKLLSLHLFQFPIVISKSPKEQRKRKSLEGKVQGKFGDIPPGFICGAGNTLCAMCRRPHGERERTRC